MDLSNHPAVMVLSIAVVSSLLSEIRIGVRIPVAVWEILLGMILGPAVLGLASISHGELWAWFSLAGLAALLFMAGMDIDFGRVRGRPIELAVGGWLLSLGLALFLSAILWLLGIVQAPMMIAVCSVFLDPTADDRRYHREIGLRLNIMQTETATALIGAGLLSVLLFPAIADATLPPPVQSETASATD